MRQISRNFRFYNCVRTTALVREATRPKIDIKLNSSTSCHRYRVIGDLLPKGALQKEVKLEGSLENQRRGDGLIDSGLAFCGM